MKNLSFGIFNVISVFLIVLLIVLILLPFNLINLEQAQRIAKWKSEYEQLNYCFSLVNLHEGSIVPTNEEAGIVVSSRYMYERIKPYFDLIENPNINFSKYNYRKMNGNKINKMHQFYFDKFFVKKDGVILSIKQNEQEIKDEKQPLFYMFVDINGIEKPNRIGQDIFIINIYKNYIAAMGNSKTYAKLKYNCSPLGNGLYCSEYYLLGGRF